MKDYKNLMSIDLWTLHKTRKHIIQKDRINCFLFAFSLSMTLSFLAFVLCWKIHAGMVLFFTASTYISLLTTLLSHEYCSSKLSPMEHINRHKTGLCFTVSISKDLSDNMEKLKATATHGLRLQLSQITHNTPSHSYCINSLSYSYH